jgi:hypothetical protein
MIGFETRLQIGSDEQTSAQQRQAAGYAHTCSPGEQSDVWDEQAVEEWNEQQRHTNDRLRPER